MSRASDNALDALHAILAEGLTEELRRNLERSRLPRTICVEGRSVPNPDYEPLSPKTAAVAAKFLKDNGIDSPATSPRINALADQLGNLDFDEPPAHLQ
jgi:hypothetical protein